MKKYLGEGALLLNTIIWGGTFVIIKSALNDVSPMLFLGIRFLIAAIIFLPFVPKIFKGISKKTIRGGILLGFLFFLGFAAQTIGLKYTSATKSGFISGTFVIFIPFLQFFIERKVPSKMNLLGVLFVFIGLIFLSSKGQNFLDIFSEIGSNFNIGDTLTLLCSILFAMYMVYLDKITRENPFMPLVILQIFVTGLSALLISAFNFTFNLEQIHLHVTSNLVFALLYTSILATIITTTLQTKFQKVVTPTKAGIILSLEPIFAALAAFFILGEKVSNFGFMGCILIFTGLLVTEILEKRINKIMGSNEMRAEIIANGLVQGVGFRYYVIRHAQALNLKGFTKNLFTGEVQTVVEGPKAMIEDLFLKIKVGPSHASVNSCKIYWRESQNEFNSFEVRY